MWKNEGWWSEERPLSLLSKLPKKRSCLNVLPWLPLLTWPENSCSSSHRREGLNFPLRSQNWAPVSARKLPFGQVCPGGRILVIPPSFPKRKLTPFSKETLWIYFLEKNLKLLFSQWWVSFPRLFLVSLPLIVLTGTLIKTFLSSWEIHSYVCFLCLCLYFHGPHWGRQHTLRVVDVEVGVQLLSLNIGSAFLIPFIERPMFPTPLHIPRYHSGVVRDNFSSVKCIEAFSTDISF